MHKRNVLFYVFVSFLILGVIAYFYFEWIASPVSIILFAIIFKYIIGTHWKNSFKLAALNYLWVLLFSLLFIGATMMATIHGEGTGNTGLLWAIALLVIGIPITTIALNWTGTRKFEPSILDKFLHGRNVGKLPKLSMPNLFISWLVFSAGVWVAIQVLPFINVTNKWVVILLTGAIIEIISKIVQIFRYNNRFVVNKYFLFWILVMSVAYFVSSEIVKKIQIINEFGQIALIGLGIVIVVRLVKYTRIQQKILR